MKTNYSINILFLVLFATIGTFQIDAQAIFRMVEVDPLNDTVTIRNFGNATDDVGSHRLCSLITYRTLSTQTTIVEGSFNLAPGEEVTVSIANDWLDDSGADLGLYVPTGSFGSAANMIDFTQWGSGGNGREGLAVTNGFWTAGTFINVAPPYEFTGTVADFGVNFWQTTLSTEDLNSSPKFSVYPNPSNNILNIVSGNQNGLSYQIFDILGKQVLTETLATVGQSAIDVSNWNNGLYIIRISIGDQTETKRFIKN